MNRGFIQIPILVAIIIGAAIIGGGGYFVAKEISKPTSAVHTEVNVTEQEAATSTQEIETPSVPATQTPAAAHQPSSTYGTVPSVQTSKKEELAPTQVNSTNTSTNAGASITAPTPKVKVTASPSSVEYGGTSVISWVVTDASSCTLGSSSILLAVAGSQSVSPTNSDWSKSNKTTYTVTCTGAGGSVSEEASVTVQSWVPSVECKKAAEGTPTVKGQELNPTLCSKLTM